MLEMNITSETSVAAAAEKVSLMLKIWSTIVVCHEEPSLTFSCFNSFEKMHESAIPTLFHVLNVCS